MPSRVRRNWPSFFPRMMKKHPQASFGPNPEGYVGRSTCIPVCGTIDQARRDGQPAGQAVVVRYERWIRLGHLVESEDDLDDDENDDVAPPASTRSPPTGSTTISASSRSGSA